MAHYDLELRGAITGGMWWPNDAQGYVPASFSLNREAGRFTAKPTLREILLHILMENGGDFQSANFTADTTITVVSRQEGLGRRKCHSREWPITAFPSVSDLLAPDTFSNDWSDDDEH